MSKPKPNVEDWMSATHIKWTLQKIILFENQKIHFLFIKYSTTLYNNDHYYIRLNLSRNSFYIEILACIALSPSALGELVVIALKMFTKTKNNVTRRAIRP